MTYNRPNRRFVIITAAVTAVVVALLFILAFTGDRFERLLSALGFDTTDYENETTTEYLDAASGKALELIATTRLLSIDSVILPEFSDTSGAVRECTDSILNYMLTENYSKYNGNAALLAKAYAAYPKLNITTLVSASDFEAVVYKNFGGAEQIRNKSGSVFTYLDKISAYTSVGQPQKNTLDITIVSLCETEHTYRMCFYNSNGLVNSPVYRAVFVKREDGGQYLKSLKKIAANRIDIPSG